MEKKVLFGRVFFVSMIVMAAASVLLSIIPVRSEVAYVAQLEKVEHVPWDSSYYYFSNGRIERDNMFATFFADQQIINGTYEILDQCNVFGGVVQRRAHYKK